MLLRNDTLTVRTATLEDIYELGWIYDEACSYFGGDTSRELLSPLDCMNGLDLPTGGKRENYELLTFLAGEMVIGYMSVYRDFPRKDWVQIPFLYIAEAARGMGSGSQIIRLIKRYFYDAGYGALQILCSLKNTDCIRFLYANGFDKILCISDKKERDYLGIGLECKLDTMPERRYL